MSFKHRHDYMQNDRIDEADRLMIFSQTKSQRPLAAVSIEKSAENVWYFPCKFETKSMPGGELSLFSLLRCIVS